MSSQSIHVFPDVRVFFFFLWVNDILLYIFLRSILVAYISNSSCLLLSHTLLFGCTIFCLSIVLLHDKHFCRSLISGSILCPYHNFPSFPHSFPHFLKWMCQSVAVDFPGIWWPSHTRFLLQLRKALFSIIFDYCLCSICVYLYLIPFYCWVIFYCVNEPVRLSISQLRAIWIVSTLGNYL